MVSLLYYDQVNVSVLQRLVSFLELESEDVSSKIRKTGFSSFSALNSNTSAEKLDKMKPSDEMDKNSSSSSKLRLVDEQRIRLTKAVVSTLEVHLCAIFRPSMYLSLSIIWNSV